MSVLVLGIGNPIMSDDGIGVRVVEQLAGRYRFPEGVEIFDGGTQGLNLLPVIKGVDRLVVVDAIETGGAPGTLVRMEGDEIQPSLQAKLSPHQSGLHDLLATAALMGHAPKEIVLLGVQPERLDMGLELSPAVEVRLDELTAQVLEELARWGISTTFQDVG